MGILNSIKTEDLKEKVLLYIRSINTEDFSLLEEIFHPEFEFEFNGEIGIVKRDSLIKERTIEAQKDIYHEKGEILDIIGEKNLVIVNLVATVDRLMDNEGNKINKSSTFRTVNLFTFQDGKVSKMSWVGDSLKVKTDLGSLESYLKLEKKKNISTYLQNLKDQGFIDNSNIK